MFPKYTTTLFFIYRNDNGTARLSAYCRNACGAVTENSLQCKRCKDTLGRLICIGVFALIVFHTTVNIGMVLGVAPVIGIPLPFFSAGGTSGICLFVAIGLVLSVSYHNSTKYRMFYTEKE